MSTSAPKGSGLQKDILSLYRRILRAAIEKDRALGQSLTISGSEQKPPLGIASLLTSTNTTTAYAASEFRRQAAAVKRSDFRKIEYMIRKGDKHIKLLRMPGMKMVMGTRSQSQ